MGSPSPGTGHGGKLLKKDGPGTGSSKVAPHRRTSSVASSCVSLESLGGDQQDVLLQSPARSTLSNGLHTGKSPVASATSSPRTPSQGMGSIPSPAALKKRRSSIGCSEDLARGLDFGGGSPTVEEKKHPFLTRGGGHKKVATPANATATSQTNSPGKKATSTPPGKEKIAAAGRVATTASVLSPGRKTVEASVKIDIIRRPILASEPAAGASVNGSGLVADEQQASPKEKQVTSNEKELKKSSPRASLDGKIKKTSPRSNLSKIRSDFAMASTKARTSSSNGDSPLLSESQKFSPGKSLDHGKNVKSPSPVASLKSKPGLTSPKGQKLAKRRQDTPSPPQPARVRTRTAKPDVRDEEFSREEHESATDPEHSESINDTETKSLSEDALKMDGAEEDDGSTLLPELNVRDQDMSSLEQPGDDPGFDQDTEMPTSWLSEDLPCMFSSLSRLPEPLDDSGSSSVFKDPFLQGGSSDPSSDGVSCLRKAVNNGELVAATASEVPRSLVDGGCVAVSEEMGPDWNDEEGFLNLTEDSGDESGNKCDGASRELDNLVSTLQVSVPENSTAPSKDSVSSSFDDKEYRSVGHEAESLKSIQVTENMASGSAMAEERSLPEPLSSHSHTVESKQIVSKCFDHFSGAGEIFHFGSSPRVQGMSAPVAVDEVLFSATHSSPEEDHDQLVISVLSDDESSEEFIGGSGSAPLNLKQSFDAAAEPTIAVEFESHNQVDKESPNEGGCGVAAVIVDSEKPAFGTTHEDNSSAMSEAREMELESQHGKFTSAYLDQDMMIFDFEEYWTHNVADDVESASQSEDAGQNDAEDLQSNISNMRGEAHEVAAVLPIEEEIGNPLEESVPELPGSHCFEPEPDRLSSPKQVDFHTETEKSANIHEEFEDDEVFHPFDGSEDEFSPAHISQSIDEDIQEKAFSNAESGPRYTTSILESEEHSNGINVNLQSPNVPEGKDVEEGNNIAEHMSSSVNTFLEHDPSASEAFTLEEEDLDTAPILLAVTGNGLQHLDGEDTSDERVDSEDIKDFPRYTSPSSMQAGSQKSSFENLAVADAGMAEQSDEDLGLPGPEAGQKICAETERDIAGTNYRQSFAERDVASPISKVDAGSYDVNELNMVEGDQRHMRISGAKEVEVPPNTNDAQATLLLPPFHDISEEEHTEAKFLSSLGCNEESPGNEDSTPDHELQISDEPVEENFQCMSALESHEEPAAELDHFQTLPGAVLLLPVEEPGPHDLVQKIITTPDETLDQEDEAAISEKLSSMPEVNSTDYLRDKNDSTVDEEKLEVLIVGLTEDLYDEEVDESVEALGTNSTHDEVSDYHNVQERHLLLEKSLPSDDQASKTEAALETEKALVAAFDEDMSAVALSDRGIKNMEIVPGSGADHFSSQDEPLEQLFVASNQDAVNMGVAEMKEDGLDLTQKMDKEREKVDGIDVVENKEDSLQLVNSSTKSLFLGHLLGSVDTAENTEDIAKREADNEARGKVLNESDTQVLEDNEDTVVFTLENPVAAASGQVDTPDATISATQNPPNARSNGSWMTGKEEEESLNDISEEASQIPSNDSWRNVKEEEVLDENLDEESQLPSSISWRDAKEEEVFNETLDEEEPQNLSNTSRRTIKEEEIFNEESLLEDEYAVAQSLVKDNLVGASAQNNSQRTTNLDGNGTHYNSSTTSWKAEDSEEENVVEVKENHLLKDEDVLVEDSPKISGQDTTIFYADQMEEHSNSSWTAGQEDKSLNGIQSPGRDSVFKDEHLTSQFKATDTTIWDENDDQNHNSSIVSWPRSIKDEESFSGSLKEEAFERDGDTMAMEESSPEVVEKVVKLNSTPGSDPSKSESLNLVVVEDEEEQEAWRDHVSNLHEEPLLEVVDISRTESIVAPELFNSNTSNVGVAEEFQEKQPAWKTDKEEQNRSNEEVEVTVIESSFEEPFADSDDDNTDLGAWKSDMEKPESTSNRNPEEKSILEEDSGVIVSDAGNVTEHSGALDAEVFKACKSTGKEGERLSNGNNTPQEESTLEARDTAVVESLSDCNLKKENGATIVQSSDETSSDHVEENSAMGSKPKPDGGAIVTPHHDPSGNLKCQEPVCLSKANGATIVQSSDETSSDHVEENSAMGSKPKPDGGAIVTPHHDPSGNLKCQEPVCLSEANGATIVQSSDETSGAHVEEGSAMGSKLKPDGGAIVTSHHDPSGNLKCQEPVCLSKANGATIEQSSDETSGAHVEEGSAMGSKPNTDGSAIVAPHENSSEIHQFVNAAENSSSFLVQTNHVTDNIASDEVITKAPAVSSEEKRWIPSSNETPDHETKPTSQVDATATDLEEAATEEPQSPPATLYPTALAEPPFSGSRQDRLWEEQAEAYNSGQGTPSQTVPAAPSCVDDKPPSPGESVSQPPSPPDDQIQPAAANGHATNGAATNGARNGASVAGEATSSGSSSTSQDNNVKTGKESSKQHTPLRSLLLEDARNGHNKGGSEAGGGGDGSAGGTPNGVTSSPSFIRRLFRVMSTPSRGGGGGSSAEGRDVGRDVGGHGPASQSSKLRSKSWVSCLGSPQVQQ